MANTKESIKASWKESSYKKTLSKEELKVYKQLNRNEKDDVIIAWTNGKPVNLLDENVIEGINKGEFSKALLDEKSSERLELMGFKNPSFATLNAYNHLRIGEKFNLFTNTVGMMTMDIHKQLQSQFYTTQQSQMFLISAQNDELIKQNEKIIDQNEQIINLLTQLVNK
ncbi:hypothetical protein IDG46_09340 [Staphylococcus sp. EG-SA-13]|nr:hypothetical protein [Staphylococcus sp. EG-SA-13]